MTPANVGIGIDMGATKIAAGVVANETAAILERVQVATPRGATATLDVLREVIDGLRARFPAVEAVGVGAAGMVEHSGYLRFAPNSAYTGPLRQHLADHTGLPTVVENDANTAAVAEGRFGSARGARNLVCVTVGTGIGGGILLDGRLHRGRSGIAAEIGHLVVDARGTERCGCGGFGHLETYASGTALGHLGRKAAAKDPGGALARLAGGPAEVTGQTVFEAAVRGDRTARALFGELGRWLGAGIASLVNLLDPELIVLGGGLIETGELLLAPTRSSYEERFIFAGDRRSPAPIVAAGLGPDAGLIGAATVALDLQARTPVF